jgi:hypothetical protein
MTDSRIQCAFVFLGIISKSDEWPMMEPFVACGFSTAPPNSMQFRYMKKCTALAFFDLAG